MFKLLRLKKLFLFLFMMSLFFSKVSVFSQEKETKGTIRIFLWTYENQPLKGAAVIVNKTTKISDASGMATFKLPEGEYRTLIKYNGRDVVDEKVKVFSGKVTEVIGTLNKFKNKMTFEKEYPEGATHVAAKKTVQAALVYGVIQGKVFDLKNKKPIKGARIVVKGVSLDVSTDAQGRFEIKVPVGLNTLTVIKPGFSSKSSKGLKVEKDLKLQVSFDLKPSRVQIGKITAEEYEIKDGVAVLADTRKNQKMVMDIIGAEQMSRSGDSDAAGAIRRVTGVTIIGGKYVIVRGMSERYTKSLLNGADLPSPEPEKKVVPLDIFPVDVVESLSIQKTYTVNMPGEFGGGTVNIITKKVPDNFFSASLSLGWVEGTTFDDGFLTYDGGGTDFLGLDDGTRDIPDAVDAVSGGLPIKPESILGGDGLTQEGLEEIGESFSNNWSIKKETAKPNIGFGFTVGDDVKVGDGNFHYMVGYNYSSGYKTKESNIKVLSLGGGGKLVEAVNYDSVTSTYSTDMGLLTDVGYDFNENHKIGLTSLLVRKSNDKSNRYQGYFFSEGTDIRVAEIDYTEQYLISNSLKGEHIFEGLDDLKVNWNYTNSMAGREQPDNRKIRYAFNDAVDAFILSDRADGNQRLYGELDDQINYFDTNVALPLGKDDSILTVGFVVQSRKRESRTRRFRFGAKGPDSFNVDLLQETPEVIFTPENIGPNGFQVSEVTRSTDQYDASQLLWGTYVMYDWEVLESLDLNIGLRVEGNSQKVETFELFNPGTPTTAELDEVDFLPAFNLTWRFAEDMQLRFGYARTLARPDFRELSEAPLDLIVGKGNFVGNPDLGQTTIDNLDLRWEWYFEKQENVSVALFYKNLKDPIETIVIAGSNRILTLQNVDRATNLGIEFEFRKNLRFIYDGLSDWYVNGNLSLIDSNVDLGDDVKATTSDSRALFGQSPFVFNLALGYENPESNWRASLIYNVFGKRIVEVGAEGLPDLEEEPFHSLDFVFGYNFSKRWTVKLKYKNILGADTKLSQAGTVAETHEVPSTFTLGLSYKY